MSVINQESSFNEAVLKMERIHQAQMGLNSVRINLLAWNNEYLKYNFEVAISHLTSLCYEVYPLMSEGEQKKFHKLQEMIEYLRMNKPVMEKFNTSSVEGIKNNEKLNLANWEYLKKFLYEFENFARVQVDAHGLSTVKKKDASKAAVDL